jgi:hypothetical protein
MTRAELIARLDALAEQMTAVGTELDYYGGLAEFAKHGTELCAAAMVVWTWVDELEQEPSV